VIRMVDRNQAENRGAEILTPSQSVSGVDQTLTSIRVLYQQVVHHEVSLLGIVDSCISRIERLNPTLNAFTTVLSAQARDEAKVAVSEISAGGHRGLLHGVPIGIKDFYDTAGIGTTAAFEHFKDRVPEKDAAGVTKLRNAGAIMVGKTNMHRLGMGTTGIESAFGPVLNPWNAGYIPGGSSSGSAAAVATGMCYATLDTDAIGSCRLPASCCGVVGFKGTYGLISPRGILQGEQDPGEMIRWFNHPGIMTRRVEDTAVVLDVLAERGPENSSSYLESILTDSDLRIGVANNYRADRETSESFEAAVELIRSLGYSTVNIAAPIRHPFDDLSRIETDRRRIIETAFCDVDVFLLPTTVSTVPTIEEAQKDSQALSPANTMFANYYGLPAISIPSGFDRNGLPIGLQIVGRPWDDTSVLRLGHRFQRAMP
jgi:aspartyl-tRNA(Asn)/glutamyl-tRNA(Gln) amidotransferase subunit A